jgi:lysophospholipase L1-like esterase
VTKKRFSSPPKFIFLIGSGLVLIGIFASPSILAFLFDTRSKLAADVYQTIQTLRAVGIFLGSLVLISFFFLDRFSYQLLHWINNIFINSFIFLITLILCLFLADFVLGKIDPMKVSQFRTARSYFSQVVVKSQEPLGYVHKAKFEGNIGDIPMKINSRKLRDREYSQKKQEGVFRIVCLGDSVTLGWGVRLEDTFVKKLERLLNATASSSKFEVINAGVGGYNTVQEVSFFRSEVQQLDEIDLVLLFFTVNDAQNRLEPCPAAKAESKDRIRNVSHVLREILNRRLPTISGIIVYLTHPKVDYQSDYLPPNDEGWQRSKGALRSLKSLSRKNGAKFVVFMIPAMQNLKENYQFGTIHTKLNQFSIEEKIPFFDLYAYFEGKNDSEVRISLIDGHPNESAHDLIARSVKKELTKGGFLQNETISYFHPSFFDPK